MQNPFVNNTPSSSPVKRSQVPGGRINKRPTSSATTNMSNSSSSSSLFASPVRRPRSTSSAGSGFADRFIPNRTEMDLNTVSSIRSNPSMPAFKPSNGSDNRLEWERERQAHQTFDIVLKNELFGELLNTDSNSGDTISRIQYSESLERPTTPPSGHRDGGDTDEDEEQTYQNLNSEPPTTPRRNHSSFLHHDSHRPTSNSTKGVSLFSYGSRSQSNRLHSSNLDLGPNATTSMMNNQFFQSLSPMRPESQKLLLSPGKKFREIAKVPYRVLDAPSLADDFYYDLIDWSSTDVLAVALGKSIFLSDNTTNDVTHLATSESDFTSLSWVDSGSHLAVGLSSGIVEIYDVLKNKCIRTLSGHVDRVACLSWNNHILSSGSRDRKILHRDVRAPEPFFEQIDTHSQEVCGLKWNVNENKLASGGNDNMVYVYDGTLRQPMLSMEEHTAAVKAIAWSPHTRGVLATGGGTADKKLKIWNISKALKLNEVDTGSQLCNMLWSKNTDEIITSHGYSKYNLTLWNYPTLEPMAVLKGHSFRVLHLTLSADGTTVVSGAGDETLRYWKLFDKPKSRGYQDSLITNAFDNLR
ncbi:Cdh1 [Kluyveromyces lactis]|nr:Cdh1 [Kluyveromyces lactis]